MVDDKLSKYVDLAGITIKPKRVKADRRDGGPQELELHSRFFVAEMPRPRGTG